MVLPPDGGFAPGQRNRKIERSIGLELEMPVDQMARVAEQVTTVTNRHGGFVLSSSVSTGEESAGGDFELRIPSARLRPALRDLAALADVRTQTQTGRDVTREHVTAKDRLQAARAERRSLLRRLELATTDEEAEAIRRRLDIVAGEINGLRSQLRDLRLRTDYAVVTVSLLPQDGDSGGGGAGGSFDDALGDAGDLLVGVAGVIVRALAVGLPLGLIALLGWLVGRAVRPPASASRRCRLQAYPRGCRRNHRHSLHGPRLPLGLLGPARSRSLRWRFGDQIEWRLVLIGLSESAEAYEARGYTRIACSTPSTCSASASACRTASSASRAWRAPRAPAARSSRRASSIRRSARPRCAPFS